MIEEQKMGGDVKTFPNWTFNLPFLCESVTHQQHFSRNFKVYSRFTAFPMARHADSRQNFYEVMTISKLPSLTDGKFCYNVICRQTLSVKKTRSA